MLKYKLFFPVAIFFLSAGFFASILFLMPKDALAGPAKGCQWVANIAGTAYNICQEVDYQTSCRKDGGGSPSNQ